MTTGQAERIRVLIVDDHAVVRRGLQAFLSGEPDLEVVGEVEGGQEAIDSLALLEAEGRRPDVVLMDLQMEPVDGVEATRRIRAAHDTVAVVALTSFGDERRVRAALQAGASGYLLKDADADEVAASVRLARHGQVQIDPGIARALIEGFQGHGDPAAGLTLRERDVLRLVAAGKANKEIASELGISLRTARTHVSSLLGKLRLRSRTQLALWAVRNGLVGDGDAPGDGRSLSG
ncbi:MAG TPA: response regulator transcription factor [Gaiellaceae bacterium]|nr:response regulator transcription factor [Gaiellaceae bacterium]